MVCVIFSHPITTPPPQEVTGRFATTSVTTVVLGAFSVSAGGLQDEGLVVVVLP